MARVNALLQKKGHAKVNIYAHWGNQAYVTFYHGLAHEQENVVVYGERLTRDD